MAPTVPMVEVPEPPTVTMHVMVMVMVAVTMVVMTVVMVMMTMVVMVVTVVRMSCRGTSRKRRQAERNGRRQSEHCSTSEHDVPCGVRVTVTPSAGFVGATWQAVQAFEFCNLSFIAHSSIGR
jgi:hypothetical protein